MIWSVNSYNIFYIECHEFKCIAFSSLCFYPAKSIRITCISTSFTKTTGKVCNYFCIFNTTIVNIGYILLKISETYSVYWTQFSYKWLKENKHCSNEISCLVSLLNLEYKSSWRRNDKRVWHYFDKRVAPPKTHAIGRESPLGFLIG